MEDRLRRAEGALCEQCAGEALGSVVEFKSPAEVARLFQSRLQALIPSPVHYTVAGPVTDNSELAMALADALIDVGPDGYDPARAAAQYLAWRRSRPFDSGNAIGQALADLHRRRSRPHQVAEGFLRLGRNPHRRQRPRPQRVRQVARIAPVRLDAVGRPHRHHSRQGLVIVAETPEAD